MSYKKSSILVIAVLLMVSLVFGACGIVKKQYNSKGLSNIMTVSMDETQEKVYIGTLDGCRVFAERLMIDQLHFATIKGENVSLTEAIEKGLTSVSDWKNGAWKIRKEGDAEILRYENYEIAIAYDDCVIRPLSSDQ